MIDSKDNEYCRYNYSFFISLFITSKYFSFSLSVNLPFIPTFSRNASIKWAYRRKEPITAATWFWADAGIDTGHICEQEIIKIDHSKRPRDFYNEDIIPAMLRTLKRCLINLQIGINREVPQLNQYATFDLK